MSDTEKCRLRAIVEGHVQGVGFRYFVLEEAIQLGLTGWVRNTWRGPVEVLAEGERAALDRLLQALQRGPGSAYVSEVHQDWESASGEYNSFMVLPTD